MNFLKTKSFISISDLFKVVGNVNPLEFIRNLEMLEYSSLYLIEKPLLQIMILNREKSFRFEGNKLFIEESSTRNYKIKENTKINWHLINNIIDTKTTASFISKDLIPYFAFF